MSTEKERLADELHKPARRNFTRRYVTLKGIADLWQADLVEMIPHSRVNSGYKYLLTVIDCFTKRAFGLPVKSKSAADITGAFDKILKQSPYGAPKNLQTDDGTEFFNSSFSALMRKHRINHYSSFSTKKSSIVERFNRSLKSLMYKRFTVNGNYKWVGILPALLDTYNNRVHRTIGMKPNDVTAKHEAQLLERYHSEQSKGLKWKKPKFRVGDQVRISKQKHLFEKGYTPNWTTELFRVSKVQSTVPITYLLEDVEEGEPIKGGFYEEELQKAHIKDVFLVEKVLRRNGDRSFVKWLGFDKKHNSWIKTSDIV